MDDLYIFHQPFPSFALFARQKQSATPHDDDVKRYIKTHLNTTLPVDNQSKSGNKN